MGRVLKSAVAVLVCTGVGLAKDLSVGDKAPPLKIDKWVKGEKVDPTKGDKERIYVVEFWATWCGPCRMSIPHLSEMQDHFAESKKLTIIGVTEEDDDVVEPFVKSWDKRMRYAVAVDDDGKTTKAYMKAAGVEGIPHAFIVKGGTIVWHGHPMEMDEEIVKLTGDKKWAEISEKKRAEFEERMELMEKFSEATRDEEWDDALAALDSFLKLDPSDSGALVRKYILLATKKKDTAAATKLGQTVLSTVDEAPALNELAWGILTDDAFEDGRDMKLATALAEKAVKLTGGKDAAILDTLARARYDSGQVKEAIELQEKAVKLAKGPMKKELEKTLKRYQSGAGKAKQDDDNGDHDDDDDDDDKGHDDDD